MKQKFYTLAFVALAFFFMIHTSSGQQRFFFDVSSEAKSDLIKSQSIENLRKFSVHSLNIESLSDYLLAAPLENLTKKTNGLELEIPLPNGETELFQIYESPVLAPQIAAQHPEIKTFAGKGIQHNGYKIRFSITPDGFSAIIIGVNSDAILFEKVRSTSKKNLYKSYFSSDAIMPKDRKARAGSSSRCSTISPKQSSFGKISGNNTDNNFVTNFSNGTELKHFKLAIAATAEFTASHGGSKAAALGVIAGYVNEINAIYQSELGITFTLVSGTNVIYTDAGTDPYTATDQGKMLDENQANLDNVIGSANYDIGHVFGDGGASSGGGVAVSPSACISETKAQGASDLGNEADFAHVFNLQVITHEMGHQFSMSHSYNSNIPVCTTRELTTSVEPGAGATLMSYGFTCDGDDYSNELNGTGQRIGPFLNFHVTSLTQAINYINTSATCYTKPVTGTNIIPVITLPVTSYTIPKSTPFSLTATASDGNNDPLTYSWEGTNVSKIANNVDLTPQILGSDTSAPFFRSYPPIATGTRTYPLLSAILNGSNKAKGDKLPSITTITTHTLSVRDNNGGVASKDVIVNIADSGPFLITNDPTGNHTGASTMTIEWSVNGTTAAPVNCTFVDVLLSTDGGLTFPMVLASDVTNSGSADVTLPNINSSKARIKVAPSISNPNIFFDISNQDFVIVSSTVPVTLLTFEARAKEKNNVVLTWETSQEINTAGFDVEISSNGQQFTKSGFVNGHGNSSISQKYQYSVNDLAAGIYFFRLKVIDNNGQYNYSQVVKQTISANSLSAFIYPNPTTQNFKINAGNFSDKSFSIKIVDQIGKVVLSFPNQKYDAGRQFNTSGIPAGVYHVILTGNDFNETLKLIKL